MTRRKYIENDVLCLAEFIEEDYKTLFDSWNEYDIMLGYNYKLPYTFDEYSKQCRDSANWSAVIIRLEDNKVIGRIGISAGLPDLTITVFQNYRNKKYGTTAFSLGIKYCFETLKLNKVYAGCYEDNFSSRKMIERCGFIPNPDGNILEKNIFTGEDKLQLDFVIENKNL